MTEADAVQSWNNRDDSGDPPADHPSGAIRLLPVVTFGLRAAALAGVVAGVGMAITQIGGGTDFPTLGNTCCTPKVL
ncbi:MAG TPA: hypothetical protein VFT95_15905 [Micromonosporaceae bacterium]|nr:hypothetical protein [Micromonosporaceae bacterium]